MTAKPSSFTRARRLIVGITILLVCLTAGNAIARKLGIPIPGNVVGMLLLLAALGSGLIKIENVESAAALILEHLGLYFVPAGVGLLLCGELIRARWPLLLTIILISTVAVLSVTGLVVAHSAKREKGDS